MKEVLNQVFVHVNRTYVELKLAKAIAIAIIVQHVNRTYVELKFGRLAIHLILSPLS